MATNCFNCDHVAVSILLVDLNVRDCYLFIVYVACSQAARVGVRVRACACWGLCVRVCVCVCLRASLCSASLCSASLCSAYMNDTVHSVVVFCSERKDFPYKSPVTKWFTINHMLHLLTSNGCHVYDV